MLLMSGLAFAEAGVNRTIIGRALGLNTGFALFGTAVGPFVYGVGYDVFGSFRGTILATSIPPLLLGLVFGKRAWCSRPPTVHKASAKSSLPEKDFQSPAQVVGKISYHTVATLGVEHDNDEMELQQKV
eukprot:gnl/MRDRNA2_/MRDRNA2_371055_c0_seq1.p1 gnl/MRDRNA2_/MRDRNA2_371055_c0~~gnl/MRDRNA2_/MRDRNA2_371055_c0_seq1.p1  ORF type:complete len:129 (+),score=24.91 gnl/MRDRNA2_/MRDRNA2_371055_c0_seq1:3-389(+)